MARPHRLQAEGCFYHITCRGNGRKNIYVNDKDREKFLEYLVKAKEKFQFYLHAYCLMNNHYHLLIETTQANLSRIMQYINTAYSVYYNVKHNKSGHLFQGRYKSILVEQDAYFAELTRYIHTNPVRAKLAVNPAGYRWSSYGAYIHGNNYGFVDMDKVKQILGMELKRYREFVEGAKSYPDPLKNVYAGFILGGDKFIKDKLDQIQGEVESGDFAHKRAIKNIVKPETIINAVSDYFRISSDGLRSLKKHPQTSKQAAIYLIRKKTGLTNAQVGALFGMKHAAVSMSALGFEKKMLNDQGLKSAIDKITLKFEV